MKISLLIIIVCLLGTNNIWAQTNYKKRADDYFKYYNYQRALKDYKRLYRKEKDNTELLSQIIKCIINDNTLREEALPYIEELLKLKPNDASANYFHAQALFHAHDFDKATKILTENKTLFDSDATYKSMSTQLQRYIQNAQALIQNPLDIDFINLGDHINTSRNEINPFITVDEEILFFSSDKKYNSYAGIYYFNVYVSEMEKNEHEKAKVIGSRVNSIYDEMVAGIDPEGHTLMVYHNRYKEETMSFANYQGHYRFDILEEFGAPLDGKGSEYGVWFTAQKDTVIFSGDSDHGDTNLYYAIKLPDGSWGEARALPGAINSRANENFPVLSEDGQRMYFSSDNDMSMGGYDLFYSDYNKQTRKWGKPVNMGYPVNDTYDNYNISWVYGKRHAYVSAIRPEGYGARDIYKLVFHEKDPFNYILKCDLRVEKERKLEIPNMSPHITVTDTLQNIVGQYRATSDSAQFIMALTPGTYDIIIETSEYPELTRRLVIPEKWYNTTAEKMTFILNPKNN